MTNIEEKLTKAAMLLECAMPYFEREVRFEEYANAESKGLKKVTWKKRLESVREIISEYAP